MGEIAGEFKEMMARIFLARRSFSVGGCWMNTALSGSGRVDDIKSDPQGEIRGLTKLLKITEDVRKYAAQQGIDENVAIEHGMKEKAAEFQHSGAEIYSKP
jgi:hypothetical protein